MEYLTYTELFFYVHMSPQGCWRARSVCFAHNRLPHPWLIAENKFVSAE